MLPGRLATDVGIYHPAKLIEHQLFVFADFAVDCYQGRKDVPQLVRLVPRRTCGEVVEHGGTQGVVRRGRAAGTFDGQCVVRIETPAPGKSAEKIELAFVEVVIHKGQTLQDAHNLVRAPRVEEVAESLPESHRCLDAVLESDRCLFVWCVLPGQRFDQLFDSLAVSIAQCIDR